MDQNTQPDQLFGQFDEQLQDLLTGYALDALEADEMHMLEEYIATNPNVADVVTRLDETVASFAYAVPQVEPPQQAKQRLMAQIQEDLPDATTSPPAPMTTTALAPRDPSLDPAPLLRLPSQTERLKSSEIVLLPKRLLGPIQPARSHSPYTYRKTPNDHFRWSFDNWFDFATGWKVATLAVGVATLFFIATTIQLTNQLATTTAALSEATSRLTALTQDVAILQTTNRRLQQEQQELSIELAPLLQVNQVIALSGTDNVPGATGSLFVSDDSLVLVLSGLQSLPADQSYQLWLIPDGALPISAGLVQVGEQSIPTLTADISLRTQTFRTVGLSIEPAGGSLQPTGPIVLLGQRT